MTAAASTAPLAPLVVLVPLRTVSESNQREHWSTKARRAREQRNTLRWTIYAKTPPPPRGIWPARVALPALVHLTRIAPRKLDDDNLRGALKACRDGVADALGINDGDPRIEWRYEERQPRKGEPRYAVEVTIAAKGGE